MGASYGASIATLPRHGSLRIKIVILEDIFSKLGLVRWVSHYLHR